ncbi:guided entry of tail-anchored proteins factor 1 isoform X2 [Dasypus novemcinctus]|uniref:guided entry of tail-anchored proteins factor 1 isoform X2 n=1 Tax=Dasypus novemcinctus TaxID=9361 RepID=UPI0039C9EA1F
MFADPSGRLPETPPEVFSNAPLLSPGLPVTSPPLGDSAVRPSRCSPHPAPLSWDPPCVLPCRAWCWALPPGRCASFPSSGRLAVRAGSQEGVTVPMSRVLQKDAEQEAQMRAEIQGMKQELSTVNMMDEFARYARLERKINKMTDKLKTHVKARTAQLAKIKWVISVAFYVLQAALMISLIWKYYSVPVAVVPSKWITPLDRLVAFPTRVAGGIGITCWILVCNKVVAIVLHPFS